MGGEKTSRAGIKRDAGRLCRRGVSTLPSLVDLIIQICGLVKQQVHAPNLFSKLRHVCRVADVGVASRRLGVFGEKSVRHHGAVLPHEILTCLDS